MKVGEVFTGVLKFRKTSLTVFVIITYVAVSILERFSYYNSLKLPKSEPQILAEAWQHLQVISSTKHPFTSPRNDELHDYLAAVIEAQVEGISYIEVSSDKLTNHTIFINQHDVFDKNKESNRIIYYESSNLLVKIQGLNSKLTGLLLSAHFDSVPTSFGTTDDGMGIASMLAVLQHMISSGKQPERTMIFNFNNNEEFGLLGAEAFVKHEWFKEVGLFINLEGAGAGGRPVLFRGTDKSVVDWYKYVSRPFANSIFQEGFRSGFIGSQTDYYVYEKNGLRGLDIAFYTPRSYYHTIRDGIEYTTKESLWMMARSVIEIVNHVAYSNDKFEADLSSSLYFDILNYWFVNIGIQYAFIYNVILLSIIPVIFIGFLILIVKRMKWRIGVRGWMRFPLVILFTYYTKLIFTKFMSRHNPLLISNNFAIVGTFYFMTTLFISYAILRTANSVAPVDDQKLIILVEMNVIAWVALVWATFKQRNEANCGGYIFSIIYLLISAAVIVGFVGKTLRKVHEETDNVVDDANDEDERVVENIVGGVGEDTNDVHNIVDENEEEGIDDDERQPLLGGSGLIKESEVEKDYEYEWIIQYLIFVPITVFFLYTEGLLIIEAISDTILESSYYDEAVWTILAVFSILSGIVIAPFAHKMNFILFQIVIIGVCGSFSIAYLSNGYDREHPIKFRFMESFDVNSNSSIANVFGRAGYLENIIDGVPYIKKDEVNLINGTTVGTQQLSYEGFRPWLLDGSLEDNEFNKYLNVSVISDDNLELRDRFAPVNSEIEITIAGSRECYLTFNTSNEKFKAPVKVVTIMNESNLSEDNEIEISIPNGFSRDSKGNWNYKVMQGIDIVGLHRIRWHSPSSEKINKFRVKLQWLPFLYDNDVEMIDYLGVKVQCFWSDYDEFVIINGKPEIRVRNFNDLLQFSGNGVVWVNSGPGIVQGNAYVQV